MMDQSEEIKEARDILQNLLKAKKTFRMYPQNNPVYIKTLDDTYNKFKTFFTYKDSLSLKINQNSILYDSEQIYFNPEKEDNFALFFFKDGLRELIFKNGLLREELEEFLRIIASDFDREIIDDDVVTLLWERDFKNIQYVVDEAFLVDIDEEDYSIVAEKKVKERGTQIDDLMRAYIEGFKEEEVKGISIVPLSEKDLQFLVKELEKDSADKTEKLATILLELVYQAENKSDIEDIFVFLKDLISFSMKHGDFLTTLNILKKTREIMNDPVLGEEEKKYLSMLFLYVGTEEVLSLFAEILESGIEIEAKTFEEFIEFLDKNAIPPLIKFLGELKTIRARKSLIEALIILGKKDITAVSKGLEDSRWYVVRNIIYVLRKIADKRAIEYLLKTVKHSDIRVRKEVIKSLGELGGHSVIQTLKEALTDADMHVRIAAAKALGNVGSDVAKKIMLEEVSHKNFKEKDFEEKKEFFEVLSRWKDSEVFDFLIKVLKKKTFFGKMKNDENRACAAFGLGLLGNRDALPILYKIKDSKNKLLKEFSNTAIKRLEYGH